MRKYYLAVKYLMMGEDLRTAFYYADRIVNGFRKSKAANLSNHLIRKITGGHDSERN